MAILDLGCILTCEPIDTGLTAPDGGGTFTLQYDFNGRLGRVSATFDAGEPVVFFPTGIPQNTLLVGEVYDPLWALFAEVRFSIKFGI